MKFDELDSIMRKYELSLDQHIAPSTYMVVRIDGRSFTRLTREICKFKTPFDEKFRDYMVHTVKHLMNCGFRVIYGYTESDEISLLFHPGENTFGRKVRKYNSILAGEASGAFSVTLGKAVAFDCRMIPLPDLDSIYDYFLWRQEDAHRNAINAYCYWKLRALGKAPVEAAQFLEGQTIDFKSDFLSRQGIYFKDIPTWQKYGVGMHWATLEKQGINPITNRIETAVRRTLNVDFDLPIKAEYVKLLKRILSEC